MGKSVTTRGRVVVRGANILRPPLLDSTEPNVIEIYDGFGDPMALLIRILSDDTWGLCTKTDPDWDALRMRYGLARMSPGVPASIITDASVAPNLEVSK